MNSSTPCPCCSGKSYGECCQPFIERSALPETAEKLMRSRYTAYSQVNITYIQQTMTGPAAQNYHPEDSQRWAESLQWLRLKVLHSQQGQAHDSEGWVEFIATYKQNGKAHKLHENSHFCRDGDRWLYDSGELR